MFETCPPPLLTRERDFSGQSLAKGLIGWAVKESYRMVCFPPSSGFSALDSQPSGRVFYRSQRAHRLTAHDLQH